MHGTRDSLVPIFHSRDMSRKLTAMGIPSTVIPVQGASHGDFLFRLAGRKPGEGEPAYWNKGVAFVQRHWLSPRSGPRVTADPESRPSKPQQKAKPKGVGGPEERGGR